MIRHTAASMFALVIGVATASAQAQQPVEVVRTSGGRSAVELTVGVATGGSSTGAVLGGTGVVALGDRLALELGAAWLDRGRATQALTGSASLRINLVPAGERLVPYAVLGAGVYHTRFDMDMMFGGLEARFAAGTMMQPLGWDHSGFGMMGPGYDGYVYISGSGYGPGYGPGSGMYPGGTFTPRNMPRFYAARFGVMQIPGSGSWGTRSFTDPLVTLGGGLTLDVTDRLFIRPDARALVVIGDGHTNTLGQFALGVGIAF